MSNLEQDAAKVAQAAETKALGWWATPLRLSKTAFIIACLAIFIIGAAVGHLA